MTAILGRMKEVKPNNVIHHFKRYFFQIAAHRSINRSAASQFLSDYYLPSNSPNIRAVSQLRDSLFNSRVRFFAAPVQIKKKEEMVGPRRRRLNEEIRADILRVVTDEGHVVLSRHEALKRAKDLKLDLVEVDRNAKPPVCKIMDYNRERYKKQVRDKERAKIKSAGSLKRGGCKEVRISAKTEPKDLKMKADTIKRMMERGYRVKCMATGSEDQYFSVILSQISALIEDVAYVEENKPAYLIVRHVKFGMSKKGNKKVSNDKTATSSEIHDAATACDDNPANLGEEACSEESDMGSDGEVEAPLQCEEKTAWSATSVSTIDLNLDEMFDLSQNVNETVSSQEKQIRLDNKAEASTVKVNASRFSPGVSSFADPNMRPVAQETENRYVRSAANSASPVRNPMRFPKNDYQPQPHPHPHPSGPSSRGPRQGELEGSLPINFRLPRDKMPQRKGEIQYQSNQPESYPSDCPGHRQPPINTGNPRSQSTDFGTFSSTKVDVPEGPRQGLEGSPSIQFRLPQPRSEIQSHSNHPKDNNSSGSIGYRQPPSNTGSPRSQTQSTGFGVFSSAKFDANYPNNSGPSNVTRISDPGMAPGNLNPPTSRSDGSQKSEVAPKKWGIFSK